MSASGLKNAYRQTIGELRPLADRRGGRNPYLHGGAGHDHCERRTALYSWRIIGRERGQLSG